MPTYRVVESYLLDARTPEQAAGLARTNASGTGRTVQSVTGAEPEPEPTPTPTPYPDPWPSLARIDASLAELWRKVRAIEGNTGTRLAAIEGNELPNLTDRLDAIEDALTARSDAINDRIDRLGERLRKAAQELAP